MDVIHLDITDRSIALVSFERQVSPRCTYGAVIISAPADRAAPSVLVQSWAGRHLLEILSFRFSSLNLGDMLNSDCAAEFACSPRAAEQLSAYAGHPRHRSCKVTQDILQETAELHRTHSWARVSAAACKSSQTHDRCLAALCPSVVTASNACNCAPYIPPLAKF